MENGTRHIDWVNIMVQALINPPKTAGWLPLGKLARGLVGAGLAGLVVAVMLWAANPTISELVIVDGQIPGMSQWLPKLAPHQRLVVIQGTTRDGLGEITQ
ncbi:MAG TPA: hypothetical protein IGR64_12625, partial [Leptolyngbyaceae cyanobacterium M65_K2018_010]|nr:hypothetical protein [Leptolyngbyaceae cyanobacterium M65_K2018_010]